MNKQVAAITALAIAIFYSPIGATNEEKLLPSAEEAKIKMSWKLDGRAQLVIVKNDSRLVLTHAYLVCKPYDSTKPLPKRAPSGKVWCSTLPPTLMSLKEQYEIEDGLCARQESFNRYLDEAVLPGKSKEFYFETHVKELPPVGCRLENLRGREPKFWEF